MSWSWWQFQSFPISNWPHSCSLLSFPGEWRNNIKSNQTRSNFEQKTISNLILNCDKQHQTTSNLIRQDQTSKTTNNIQLDLWLIQTTSNNIKSNQTRSNFKQKTISGLTEAKNIKSNQTDSNFKQQTISNLILNWGEQHQKTSNYIKTRSNIKLDIKLRLNEHNELLREKWDEQNH